MAFQENRIGASQSSDVRIPHPNLADQANRNIIQSEIEGGVYLQDIPIEGKLEIQTENRSYTVIKLGEDEVLISGHPEFCPEPVSARVHGSTWGGSMLKTDFLGRGMHLEFQHPGYKGAIITSRIVEIRQTP